MRQLLVAGDMRVLCDLGVNAMARLCLEARMQLAWRCRWERMAKKGELEEALSGRLERLWK